MNKSTRETMKPPKKRPTSAGTPVMVRLQAENLAELDNWRRSQNDVPGRAEALRRLMLDGIKYGPRVMKVSIKYLDKT